MQAPDEGRATGKFDASSVAPIRREKKSRIRRVFMKINGMIGEILPRIKKTKDKEKTKKAKKARKRERDPRLPPQMPKGQERQWTSYEAAILLHVVKEVQNENDGKNKWLEVEKKLIEDHNVLRSWDEARNKYQRYMDGENADEKVFYNKKGEPTRKTYYCPHCFEWGGVKVRKRGHACDYLPRKSANSEAGPSTASLTEPSAEKPLVGAAELQSAIEENDFQKLLRVVNFERSLDMANQLK